HELKPGHRMPLTREPRPEGAEVYFMGIANGIVYGDGSTVRGSSSRITLYGEKEELAKYLLPYSDNDSASRHVNGLYVGRLPKRFKEEGTWLALPFPRKG